MFFAFAIIKKLSAEKIIAKAVTSSVQIALACC